MQGKIYKKKEEKKCRNNNSRCAPHTQTQNGELQVQWTLCACAGLNKLQLAACRLPQCLPRFCSTHSCRLCLCVSLGVCGCVCAINSSARRLV